MDIFWAEGILTEFVIRADKDYRWQLKYGMFSMDISLRKGEEKRLEWSDGRLREKGEEK